MAWDESARPARQVRVRQCFVVLFLMVSSVAFPQTPGLRLEVRSEGAAVESADVVVNGRTFKTDGQGTVSVPADAGAVAVTVIKDGFVPVTTTVIVPPHQTQSVLVELTRQPEEHVTVSATRTNSRLEDVPMRVEVLSAEEIAEKVAMTPGDIVMMLNEMGGLRVQATSPSLGAASIRIQGMRGRYTRFLSDGLPLFGDQVGGLGLLQIPPLDLAQVEVIKGVASALYGAGAMGGVVNLVSRRPTEKPSKEFLANRSSRGATDAIAFLSGPLGGHWAATLLGGGHGQERNDVDGNGWADLPGYKRGEVRPRLFWDNGTGGSVFLTTGAMWESRTGGTVAGAVLPSTRAPYLESLDTSRFDVGGVAQTLVAGAYVFTARASAAWKHQDHILGDVRERDRGDTVLGELAVRRNLGRQTFVVGAAVERAACDFRDVPAVSYAFTTPGVFVQDDVDVTPWLTVSGSGRVDRHSAYGTFVSPRGSALFRRAGWTSRVSAGAGFFPATPTTEETEAAGLSTLTVHGALRAETGRGVSVDVSRSDGPLSYTVTLFASRVAHPVWVNRVSAYTLENRERPTTNAGAELLATWRLAPVSVTANYTYVRARQFEETTFEDVPLTPRHAAGLVAVWEREHVGRVGVEWYYTGRQRLEANPFRRESTPYRVLGVLVERVLGPVRVFVNGENLTNVRQTQFDPLIRPTRGVDGRWTVDAWSPLDGRNINAGIRARF